MHEFLDFQSAVCGCLECCVMGGCCCGFAVAGLSGHFLMDFFVKRLCCWCHVEGDSFFL